MEAVVGNGLFPHSEEVTPRLCAVQSRHQLLESMAEPREAVNDEDLSSDASADHEVSELERHTVIDDDVTKEEPMYGNEINPDTQKRADWPQVICSGIPIQMRLVSDKTRRQLHCKICGEKTAWYCLGCKQPLCLSYKEDGNAMKKMKTEKKTTDLRSEPIYHVLPSLRMEGKKGKSPQEICVRHTCYHKAHQQDLVARTENSTSI